MVSALAFGQDVPQVPSHRPGREASLPPDQIKDTFFAYVLGIITAGLEVDVDNAGMRAILTEFKSSLQLPFELVERVTQHLDTRTEERAIGLDFQSDVSIPIPFALLFYHPGSITASSRLVLLVTRSVYMDPGANGVIAPVFDLLLVRGSVRVDIDNWLEVLLGAFLEDFGVRHIVFFTWHGDWIGLLEGTGRRTGRVLRGYFNFTKNRIVFPTPGALENVGKLFVPDAQPANPP